MEARAPHRSLYAVWHWPRWTWAVLVVLAPLLYLLSATPVVYLADTRLSWALEFTELFYRPATLLAEHSSMVRSVFGWQWDKMIELFPPPEGWRETYL